MFVGFDEVDAEFAQRRRAGVAEGAGEPGLRGGHVHSRGRPGRVRLRRHRRQLVRSHEAAAAAGRSRHAGTVPAHNHLTWKITKRSRSNHVDC